MGNKSNLSIYLDGKVQIADGGWKSTIKFTGSQTISITQSALKIPIIIRDDDNFNAISSIDFTNTINTFKEVFIDFVIDGGIQLSNNQSNLPFFSNVSFSHSALNDKYSLGILNDIPDKNCNSYNYEYNRYWVAYLLSTFQYTTANDKDPSFEYSNAGLSFEGPRDSHCTLSQGSNYSIVFHETIRDITYQHITNSQVALHELGHAFGLTHGYYGRGVCAMCVSDFCNDGKGTGMGVMGKISDSSINRPSYFISLHQHFIRSRVSSPGK